MRALRCALGGPLAALLAVLATGCGSSIESGASTAAPGSCSVAELERQMDTTLSQVAPTRDFSFAVDRRDGRRYAFNRGGSTLRTSYESKSASKLVSAVIILRLVERGDLALSSRPQDLIPAWPIGSGDPLLVMNLAHLLSLTSGLTIDPPCLNAASADLQDCVISIARASAGNSIVPGQAFFYASSHLQVAGLMAAQASGMGWQAIVAEFKTLTGLFPASTYDWPSLANANLAGGMHFTGEDYMAFLNALRGGSILNAASMNELLSDRTASIPILYSPMFAGIAGGPGLGEDWHYGFGLWHECRSPTFNCVPGTRVSSPGALGTYPFWDRSKGYTGIVAMAGEFGFDLNSGIHIERSVRPLVERWAAC